MPSVAEWPVGVGSWHDRGITIILDFDGTITEQETLDLLVERFGDSEAHAAAQQELGKTLALADVITRAYGSLAIDREQAVAWLLKNVRFRPGFNEFVDLARTHGWPIAIVSSGLRELIEPLLEHEGIDDVPIVANTLVGERWAIAIRDDGLCPACLEQCKRGAVEALSDGGRLVYVGDGYSDGCAAAASDLVFARRRLSTYLDERGIPYQRFEDFYDVAATLTSVE